MYVCIYVPESVVATLYVGSSTNTKFKPLLLQTQSGIPYTNIYKHETSYFKFTLKFLDPAKWWKFISVNRHNPKILAIFSSLL